MVPSTILRYTNQANYISFRENRVVLNLSDVIVALTIKISLHDIGGYGHTQLDFIATIYGIIIPEWDYNVTDKVAYLTDKIVTVFSACIRYIFFADLWLLDYSSKTRIYCQRGCAQHTDTHHECQSQIE